MDLLMLGLLQKMSRGGGKSALHSSSYTISNAMDYPLLGLSLYGKSTQDGVPSPEAPVDIISVGDSGSVEVEACCKNLVDPDKINIGGLDYHTGAEINNFARARTGYISVTPACLVGSVPNDYSILSIYNYTSKKEYLGIGGASLLNGKNGFIRLLFKRNDGAVITDDDLNTLKNTIIVTNGESVDYEPYKGNTASITTALPLCGIPVESGGNYTDSNGQQWVCDELIYNADGTGKVVKRTAAYTITEDIHVGFLANSGSYQRAVIRCALDKDGNQIIPKDGVAICSAYRYDTYFRYVNTEQSIDDYAGCFSPVNGGKNNINMRFSTTATTAEQFISENLGVEIIYQRETPKEIELTAAEMSALSQLQTYSGVTNIFNSGGANMDVKFCTNKMLSECVLPITAGLQKQIDGHKPALLFDGNIPTSSLAEYAEFTIDKEYSALIIVPICNESSVYEPGACTVIPIGYITEEEQGFTVYGYPRAVQQVNRPFIKRIGNTIYVRSSSNSCDRMIIYGI